MRSYVLVGGAATLGVVYVVGLLVPGMDDLVRLLLSNLGQLAAAALASVSCALAARRTAGRRRTAWSWSGATTR